MRLNYVYIGLTYCESDFNSNNSLFTAQISGTSSRTKPAGQIGQNVAKPTWTHKLVLGFMKTHASGIQEAGYLLWCQGCLLLKVSTSSVAWPGTPQLPCFQKHFRYIYVNLLSLSYMNRNFYTVIFPNFGIFLKLLILSLYLPHLITIVGIIKAVWKEHQVKTSHKSIKLHSYF